MLAMILALSPGCGVEISAWANAGETNALAPNPTILFPATGLFNSITAKLQEGCASKDVQARNARWRPINSCPTASGWSSRQSGKSAYVNGRQVMLTCGGQGACESSRLKLYPFRPLPDFL